MESNKNQNENNNESSINNNFPKISINKPELTNNMNNINNIYRKQIFAVVYDKKQKTKDEIIKQFELENKKCRKDYYIKHFKTKFVKWLIKKANILLHSCKFNKYIEDFSLPNYPYFTGETNEVKNKIFLNYSVKEILTYYKKNDSKINLQLKNINIIKNIESFKYNNENNYKKLWDFLSMSLESAYYLFYDDKSAFDSFCNDEYTIFYEHGLKKMHNISLIKNYGFINMLKNIKNNDDNNG